MLQYLSSYSSWLFLWEKVQTDSALKLHLSLFTSLISPCWAEIFNHKNTSRNSISYPTWICSNLSTIPLLYQYLPSSHNWNPLGLHLSRTFLRRQQDLQKHWHPSPDTMGVWASQHAGEWRACRCSQVLPHLHWTTAKRMSCRKQLYLKNGKIYF